MQWLNDIMLFIGFGKRNYKACIPLELESFALSIQLVSK